MSRRRALVGIFVILAALFAEGEAEAEAEEKQYMLTLDHTNFSDTVAKHNFIIVEFHALDWCGYCKRFAPQYEKAASILSSHHPPITLARVNISNKVNLQKFTTKYRIQSFPSIKILRDGGNKVQDYKGPLEADGIVTYLKKQAAPASTEIKSREDAASLIDEKKIFVAGVFPKFSGVEFENFITLAEKLRADYDFAHTLDTKHLPRGKPVDKPTLRLLKPFDELFADYQDFDVDAMEKFINEASTPKVTVVDKNPDNYPYIDKFFRSKFAKVLLFVNFSSELDAFKSKYDDIAALYKGKDIGFLLGDVQSSGGVFQYFKVNEDQAPLVLGQTDDGEKYLKPNVEPDQIATWVKDFKDGKLKPFLSSEPIPKNNSEPVKVVVTDSLEEMVFNSGKNVLLEFYGPWCDSCKRLAPILDEVAISLENDPNFMIAKLDGSANDIPKGKFNVIGYPTLYFKSASGNLLQYEGNRTKEDIIDFIQKNRDKTIQSDSATSEEPSGDEL